MPIQRKHILLFASIVLVCLLGLYGINAVDRPTWLLEIFPILIALPILWVTYSRFPLTNLGYICIFFHALVLMLGGIYTYAKVPFGFYLADILNLSRNPYDKIGHFFKALCLFWLPARFSFVVIMSKVRR